MASGAADAGVYVPFVFDLGAYDLGMDALEIAFIGVGGSQRMIDDP